MFLPLKLTSPPDRIYPDDRFLKIFPILSSSSQATRFRSENCEGVLQLDYYGAVATCPSADR